MKSNINFTEKNNNLKLELSYKNNTELLELTEKNPELIPIIEDIIIERNEIRFIFNFAREHADNINLEKFEDVIIRTGNPFEILYFAEDISGVNLGKLGAAYIKIFDYFIMHNSNKTSSEEIDYMYNGLMRFATIDEANIKQYEDTVIKHNDLYQIISFLLTVPKANKDRLCKVICSHDKEEYSQDLLNEFTIYAIKYLDLNKYHISFERFKFSIIKESPLDLIYYIEQNKSDFINYNQFIEFIKNNTDIETSNVLEFFEDYINDPYTYSTEELEKLKLRWNRKYEKVFEKKFN